MTGDPSWFVLLIGGPSGVGKSTVAAQVARRLGVSWLMVDDLRLALIRSGVAIPDHPHVDFDAPGGLIAIAEAVAPAIEVVIENHVDQRCPLVIEGDGILPSLFERPSVRARSNLTRAVFLYESDEDALHRNVLTRARAERPGFDAFAYAYRSARYGAWLKKEAEQRGLPTVAARPWDTLADRSLEASGLPT